MNKPKIYFHLWRTRTILYATALSALLLVGSIAQTAEHGPTEGRQGMTALSDVRKAELQVASARREVNDTVAHTNTDRSLAKSKLMSELSYLAMVQSMSGQGNAAIETFNEQRKLWIELRGEEVTGDLTKDLDAISISQSADAVETIAIAAKQRQIVILNELHHVSYHRAFALRLARRLRKEGFGFLAIETFRGDALEAMPLNYATRSTGVYSREPTFAQFLADAKADGWMFVGYEPDHNIGNREFGMAKNIIERVLDRSPNGRIFIYVGYSHARKIPIAIDDSSPAKMAAHLKRLTGIDPLTIDQTLLNDYYFGEAQSAMYQAVTQKALGKGPVVLIGTDGEATKFTGEQAGFDFHVVHPPYNTNSISRRPEWMSLEPKVFHPYPIPNDLIPTEGLRLVYAFPKNSGYDAVPLDMVLLSPDEPETSLMLISDQYELAHEDISD